MVMSPLEFFRERDRDAQSFELETNGDIGQWAAPTAQTSPQTQKCLVGADIMASVPVTITALNSRPDVLGDIC